MSIYDYDPDTGDYRPERGPQPGETTRKSYAGPVPAGYAELPEDERKAVSQELADQLRRDMIATGQPQADLAADQDQTWTTEQLTADFEVIGFSAPYVVVRRRSDGKTGTLEFTHHPRIYFSFEEAS